MTLFAVLALKDSVAAVDAAVSAQLPEDSYKIEAGKWIVSADVATARQLSTKLGLRETAPHLVVSIRGYSGRAQPELWEWLAAQSEKENG
jgi:hypothetical protein